MKLDSDQMSSVVTRLKRAQGQLGGIIAMIEAGRDCEDIVTQLAAVGKAVDRAAFLTISTGLRQCMVDPDSSELDAAKLEKLFLSLA